MLSRKAAFAGCVHFDRHLNRLINRGRPRARTAALHPDFVTSSTRNQREPALPNS
jgi:hypothetical protein